ncbi:MAG TPA: CDP-alcohol phosphatidyltransferase family protein [Acidimicrobiales bacterium]|nr:CDP-alcohol phosphatidyltransferase family protein [Acidimicrobiales bacterium]
MPVPRDGERRIWTIPNVLSIGRVALFVWFLEELFFADDRFLAAVALSIAGVTDYLDGFIARRFDQASELGKFLDPAVDRLMTTGTLVSLMVFGAIPLWLGSLILAREVVVSVAALFVASKGIRDIEVVFIGKLGTFGFMCALPMILFGSGRGQLEHAFGAAGWVILAPSLVLAIASAWIYLPRIRAAFGGRNSLTG